jgi:hypothetical protein
MVMVPDVYSNQGERLFIFCGGGDGGGGGGEVGYWWAYTFNERSMLLNSSRTLAADVGTVRNVDERRICTVQLRVHARRPALARFAPRNSKTQIFDLRAHFFGLTVV